MGEALVADSSIGFQINGQFGRVTDVGMTDAAVTRVGDAATGPKQHELVAYAADPAEKALIRGLCDGQEAAYEALISQFEHPIYNLIARLTDEPSDVADAVQEVFLKVFRNVGAFRGGCSLKTWIYRIAVNEARNHLRWFSRHRRKEVGIEPSADHAPSAADWIADPGHSPLQMAMEHETQALVERVLAQVNPAYRAALVLREIEGMSYDEIAHILEISLGTVKSRIVRGREDLRERLSKELNPNVSPTGHAAWRPKEVMAE
jgi:RNA polymerase sigma-70 factor, ECF subfamily